MPLNGSMPTWIASNAIYPPWTNFLKNPFELSPSFNFLRSGRKIAPLAIKIPMKRGMGSSAHLAIPNRAGNLEIQTFTRPSLFKEFTSLFNVVNAIWISARSLAKVKCASFATRRTTFTKVDWANAQSAMRKLFGKCRVLGIR